MQPPKSDLDPRSANVNFHYGEIVPGDGVYGRVYYWYDPDGRVPAIDEYEFRSQHPEISDREWERLFYDAFQRGEGEFEEMMFGPQPELDDSAKIQSASTLGRLFGPRPPD